MGGERGGRSVGVEREEGRKTNFVSWVEKKKNPSFSPFSPSLPPSFLSIFSTVTSNPPEGGEGGERKGGEGGRGREREHPSQRRVFLIKERGEEGGEGLFFCFLLVTGGGVWWWCGCGGRRGNL